MKKKKSNLFFVLPPNTIDYGMDILTRALCEIGTCLGFRTWEVSTKTCLVGTSPDDVLVFFAPRIIPEWQKFSGTKIILNVHPTCPGTQYAPIYRANFVKLKNCVKKQGVDWIFEFNLHTTKWMVEAGLPAVFMPIGYHESFEMPCVEPIGPPGAYFLGTMYGGRADWFEENTWVSAHNFQKCPWMRPALMHTDGVHLHTYIREFRTFHSLRIITLLLANKRCVLSETSDWSPIVDGEHYMVAKIEDFREAASKLLSDNKLRRDIGENGYEFVRKNHRLGRAFEQALDIAGLL